jgi:hypothetical protein
MKLNQRFINHINFSKDVLKPTQFKKFSFHPMEKVFVEEVHNNFQEDVDDNTSKSSAITKLGDRMKQYESQFIMKLDPKLPFIIRYHFELQLCIGCDCNVQTGWTHFFQIHETI